MGAVMESGSPAARRAKGTDTVRRYGAVLALGVGA